MIEKVSIAWNILEGLASLAAGIAAHSVALVAFGADSVIEVAGAVAVFRRLQAEAKGISLEEAERHEKRALGIVGITFLLLSAYVIYRSASTLWCHQAPESSPLGIGVTVAALVAMPLLAKAKKTLGDAVGSRALMADAKETLACAWLAAISLLGVGLNAVFGWWWADPVAALLLVPFLVREGREALQEARGKAGCSDCHD